MDLQGRLAELAGAEVTADLAAEGDLEAWDTAERARSVARFEFRILVGLAIWDGRPDWGSVGNYQSEVAEALGRTDRWVRRTTAVAREVRGATQAGVSLPLEIREVAWFRVPKAIENVRAGRPLDWVDPAQAAPPGPEAWEQGVRTQLAQLVRSLKAAPAGADWRRVLREVLATLRAVEDGTASDGAREVGDSAGSGRAGPGAGGRGQGGRGRPRARGRG